ncbi:cytochrome P450 [Priestia aryabhattai]|uniref:cytochrome P450 n=1 Tax=Priestia aryabhattai TaxID=412384 RepID=UPI00187467B5|nr:cytochrome P450 [Priestia aryabhattai]MBE5102262.1 cytochrome P450 [Priestia aryabhattai]
MNEEKGNKILLRNVFETTEDIWEGRFVWYKQMRKESPIRYDEKTKIWDVFLYEDIVKILKNPKIFSSERKNKNIPTSNSIIAMDPPRHNKIRALVNKAFTPRTIQLWSPRIQWHIEQLLENINGENQFDIVKTIAYPLPLTIIATIIGVPNSDMEKFREWTMSIVSGPADNSKETIEKNTQNVYQGFKNLTDYFSQIIKKKRNEPQDDIISVLVRAEEDGFKLSDEEIIGFSTLLLIAGHETTTNLITNSVYCFLEDELLFNQIKQDPALLPKAIEEVLRYRSPVHAMPRIVKEDTEMRGQKLKAGDEVVLWIGSANRDENQFDFADEFNLHRTLNSHLAFGTGIHFCLGAPLSRLEANLTLLELIKRFPNMRLSNKKDIKPLQSPLMYGLKSLQITVE